MSGITQLGGRRRPLAATLEAILEQGIRDGRWPKGTKLPTEADLLAEYGVSRTVVREAVSRLQAAGKVVTRHGIGTFVVNAETAETFRIRPDQIGTLDEVLTVLELRIAVESEAAALAALRRTDEQLQAMATALEAFSAAVDEQRDAVEPDFQFHLQIAKATDNVRFMELMAALGGSMIPRARLNSSEEITPERAEYLRRVNAEHAEIFGAIQEGDTEGARAAMRAHLTNSRERRRLSGLAR
jgi:GntR family transcriptional repressor for pyruvate dehydrogenase complex